MGSWTLKWMLSKIGGGFAHQAEDAMEADDEVTTSLFVQHCH